MYRPSPLFASAFPILSVAEAAKEVASSAELKAQAVKSKALEAAGEKPTGANLYARSVSSHALETSPFPLGGRRQCAAERRKEGAGDGGRFHRTPFGLRAAVLFNLPAARPRRSSLPVLNPISFDPPPHLRFALAGAVGCAVTHGAATPMDVVKTTIQLEPKVYNKVRRPAFPWPCPHRHRADSVILPPFAFCRV